MGTSSVSCNSAGATGNKAADGVLSANPSGGVPPYLYLEFTLIMNELELIQNKLPMDTFYPNHS